MPNNNQIWSSPFKSEQLWSVEYREIGRWSVVGIRVGQSLNSPNRTSWFSLYQVGRIEVKIFRAKISSHLGHPFVLLHRHVLDFDFEKLCSVSLSHINIYACLVCGRYFQGKNNSLHSQSLLFGEVLSFQAKINLKNKKNNISLVTQCNEMER